jgi:hypothetical protein
VTGEGCFLINILKNKTGFSVSLKFTVGQHSRDAELIKSLINYLGCGQIYLRSNKDAVDFVVSRYSDISEKIIPFFDKYTIKGTKVKDLEDFKRVADIMKKKEHLTPEGLKQIRLIKAGTNSKRKN